MKQIINKEIQHSCLAKHFYNFNMNIKVNLLVIVLYVICFQDYSVDGTIIIVEDNKGEMRKR